MPEDARCWCVAGWIRRFVCQLARPPSEKHALPHAITCASHVLFVVPIPPPPGQGHMTATGTTVWKTPSARLMTFRRFACRNSRRLVRTCAHACMARCMCILIRSRYACAHTRMYAHILTRMHAYTHIHVYTHKNSTNTYTHSHYSMYQYHFKRLHVYD